MAKAKVDRTYLAVRRQLEAMGVDQFEVGIRDRDGRMMTRAWSRDETLKSVGWLKRENAKGADIYIRPAGDKNAGILMLDDISQATVERMYKSGMEPALVVETSPQNYQAWVRLSDKALEPEFATSVSKALAKRFDADPNSADWRHFGRLAGFTNRKPEHTTERGMNPWVLAHQTPGKQATRGPELLDTLREAQREHQRQLDAVHERQRRLEAAREAPEASPGHDPIREYQRQLNRLTKRYGDDMDASRADFMITKDMAKRGYSAKQLKQALEQASPELPTRKAGHEQDYVQRTIKAVYDDPDVQKTLVEQAAARERAAETQIPAWRQGMTRGAEHEPTHQPGPQKPDDEIEL